MPGTISEEEPNQGKTHLRPQITVIAAASEILPKETPALGISKEGSSTNQDEKPWFEASVKGIDRGRPLPAPAACNRVPDIKLYGVKNIKKLREILGENIEAEEFFCTLFPDRIVLEINKFCSFVWAVELLDKLGVQYHYKNTIEDKCERYVLRGIPAEYEDEISKGLKEKGFYVHDVHRIFTQKTSISAPVFIFCHTPLPEGPKVTEVRRISKWMVKVESYKGTKKEPMLCLRCCRYSHTATFCTVNPRCFKCAKAHEGSTCDKRVAYKCCNCNGPHPATSKCCPLYQRVKVYNTKARPQPPLRTTCRPTPFSAFAKPKPKEIKAAPPSGRLQRLIAKSFVMVGWNAQGVDVENCPEFLKFLEIQGAQLVCISGSHPLSEAKWNALGWSVLTVNESMVMGKRNAVRPSLLIQQNVPHIRLRTPPLKHMSAVIASVETRCASIKVAVAYVGPNDSFVPEDINALFKEPEPTVVFGDMYARHHAWNSPVNNKRGKALNRAAEVGEFSVFAPTHSHCYYREEEVPFVVLAKKIPSALRVLPKQIKSKDHIIMDHHCPLVMHLRNWRRPKIFNEADLPTSLKDLIRHKNHLRRQWQKTKFSLFKLELNNTKASLKARLEEYRQESAKKRLVKHESTQI